MDKDELLWSRRSTCRYCNVKAVLMVDCPYKQSQICCASVHIEEIKYTDAETQQCNMFSFIQIMMDFFMYKEDTFLKAS